MRSRRPGRAGLLLLALPLPGCLDERVDVEVTTRIHADGSCLRRTEYRFERPTSDGETPGADVPENDPLRTLHRYPSGEPWQVRHEVTSSMHTVTSEALLPAPCHLDWDYWRVKTPGAALVARNRLSFAVEGEEGAPRAYDFLETFVDPASPLAAGRRLIELLARTEEAFADRFRRELGPAAAPRGADVRRDFREHFLVPAARVLAEIAERGMFGPREKQDVDAAWEPLADALAAALSRRARAADSAQVGKAAQAALEAVMEPAGEQLEKEGHQIFELFGRRTVRFRVTLVMPAPVMRANACIQGDTVTWEFDQDDLYGRGFEMWARAVQP